MAGPSSRALRAYGGYNFLNAPHLERFQQSAALLTTTPPWSQRSSTQAIEAVLWANQLDDAWHPPGGLARRGRAFPSFRRAPASTWRSGGSDRPNGGVPGPRRGSNGRSWRVGGVLSRHRRAHRGQVLGAVHDRYPCALRCRCAAAWAAMTHKLLEQRRPGRRDHGNQPAGWSMTGAGDLLPTLLPRRQFTKRHVMGLAPARAAGRGADQTLDELRAASGGASDAGTSVNRSRWWRWSRMR